MRLGRHQPFLFYSILIILTKLSNKPSFKIANWPMQNPSCLNVYTDDRSRSAFGSYSKCHDQEALFTVIQNVKKKPFWQLLKMSQSRSPFESYSKCKEALLAVIKNVTIMKPFLQLFKMSLSRSLFDSFSKCNDQEAILKAIKLSKSHVLGVFPKLHSLHVWETGVLVAHVPLMCKVTAPRQ